MPAQPQYLEARDVMVLLNEHLATGSSLEVIRVNESGDSAWRVRVYVDADGSDPWSGVAKIADCSAPSMRQALHEVIVDAGWHPDVPPF